MKIVTIFMKILTGFMVFFGHFYAFLCVLKLFKSDWNSIKKLAKFTNFLENQEKKFRYRQFSFCENSYSFFEIFDEFRVFRPFYNNCTEFLLSLWQFFRRFSLLFVIFFMFEMIYMKISTVFSRFLTVSMIFSCFCDMSINISDI